MENFEDFLKNEAQGFKMQPSEKVWKGVQAGIVKPRRVFIWWYTAAALVLLSSGAILYFNAKPANNTSKTKTENNTTISEPSKKNSSIIEYPVNDKPGVNKTDLIEQGQHKNTVEEKRSGVDVKDEKKTATNEDNSVETSTTVSAENNRIIESVSESRKKVAVTLIEQKQIILPALQRERLVITTSQNLNRIIPIKEPRFVTPHFEYLVNAGITVSSPTNNTNYNNFLKPGGGFVLNFTTKYNFTPAWGISAGLGYQQNRYRIGAVSIAPETVYIAGSFQDSLPQNANYKLSNETQHRNVLHQIILPLALHYTHRISNKSGLDISGGIDFSRVIGSFYLIKNPANDRLFSNKDIIQPFNMYSSLGVSYTRQMNDKLGLVCGYKVQYQLRNTFDSDYHFREYLLINGLSLGIGF